jgi:hypothetical protein
VLIKVNIGVVGLHDLSQPPDFPGASGDKPECPFACPFRNNTQAHICIVLIFKYLHVFIDFKDGIYLIVNQLRITDKTVSPLPAARLLIFVVRASFFVKMPPASH